MIPKKLHRIWYPSLETFSCSTPYSIDEARRKLINAIDDDDEMKGKIGHDQLTISHTTWYWGRSHTTTFRGSWQETPSGVILEGVYTNLAFMSLWFTVVLIIGTFSVIAGVFSLISALITSPLQQSAIQEALIFMFAPPGMLALGTLLMPFITAHQSHFNPTIKQLIQQALK
ncbi:heme biosynthesis protein HemY [Escherichia sp. E3659]|uniref:heme biosynthesis protein HemY n=1 Tax=Escherichia sp. E3659 TaxID=2044462 RepID=UPI0010FDAE2D|nr:heme biosynthesis protein HemY [Escherichia sp. E3659]TLJ09811.1 heme biosynthesis protein HemY [Escherichia sp. E3659]